MRLRTYAASAFLASCFVASSATAAPPAHPNLLQRPALTKTQIVFNYAGDLWTVDRAGGHATRLTVGVGPGSMPIPRFMMALGKNGGPP